MTRRFLISSLAVGLLALGGLNAQAGSVTLASLLGTTQSYDGLDFTFPTTAWSGPSLVTAPVYVTFETAGSEVGFYLTGSFGAGPGGTNDGNLVFSVSGAPITDAQLNGNPALKPGNTTGSASVSEFIYAGATATGTPIGTLLINNLPTGPLSDSTPFGPQSKITITKDIESIGGSTGVTLSSVTQLFSTSIPEPTSLALLGIGLSGLFTLRRFFKRASVA